MSKATKRAVTHRKGPSGGVLCGSPTWRVAARPSDAPSCKRCAALDGTSSRRELRGGKAHVLGYARVSRADQNLDAQVRQLEDAGCGRIYSEHVSGVGKRAQWARLVEDARSGDTVVVVRLDRIGRRMSEVVSCVQSMLDRGVHVRALAQGIDTTAAAVAPLLLAVFAALAESERATLIERTAEGLAAARARGAVFGRPRRVTDAVRAQMRHLRGQGYSMAEIGKALHLHKATVSRELAAALKDDPRQLRIEGA